MGAVLEFRRDKKSKSRLFKKKKNKKSDGIEMGKIIIFPGIRIERHHDDYLTDEQDSDTQNAG